MRFGYSFPAIRGLQAGREYFTSMCPLRLIPKIFLFDEAEAELSPELRAQRMINHSRIPEIKDYLINNTGDYVFSALTASIDADVEFQSLAKEGQESMIGLLHVPMGARFIINDGQHRRAAIEEAIKEKPELGGESISVVFFLDRGLQRCQQMFADLNRHGVRPSTSIGVLYDHRDDMAKLTRMIVLQSDFFKDLVEMERSSLSPRSRKLFTLSSLYHATAELLGDSSFDDVTAASDYATKYWEAVAEQIPEWQFVRQKKMSSGELRKDFIHAHGIAIHAFGRAGNTLIEAHPEDWQSKLEALKNIDWSRSNTKIWEGRALNNGRVSKANQNVTLTTNFIKSTLGLELTADEMELEATLSGGRK